MTLPISSIVNVTISVSQGIPPKRGFGIMGLLSEDLDSNGRPPIQDVVFFNSIDEIADVYDNESETYLQAQTYFSASPRPETIAVLFQSLTAMSGVLECGSDPMNQTLTWQAVTDGAFDISISGDEEQLTGLDFSGITDLSDVATVIQTALQAVGTGGYTSATCVYNSTKDMFIVTAGDSGNDSSVSFLSVPTGGTGTDITTYMNGTSLLGAVQFRGTAVESEIDALDKCQLFDDSWYGLCVNKKHRDTATAESIADWAQARIKWHSACTNDPTTLLLGQTNFASKMMDASMDRVSVTYSSYLDEYPECAVLGRAFVVDFTAPNATITVKFKNFPSITAERLTSNQKNALDGYRCNAMINVGGANMYAESYMSYNMFMDTRHGIDWLQGEIESRVFAYLLSRPTKVPLTDAGASSILQQVIRALDTAVLNGFVGTGTTIDGEYLGLGYTTDVQKVADMNPADKAQRVAPTISFIALLAGAVHGVQVNGVVEQ